MLAREPDVAVVAEADDGDTAVALATELLPDVVLMDLRLGRMDGVGPPRGRLTGTSGVSR